MGEIYCAELLTNVFGYWPDFHDAEIVRLTLERTANYDAGPSLLLDVHAFEMTGDVDAHGHYVLRHHVLVTLRFDGVQDLELDGFNNQNAISGIEFKDIATAAFPAPAHEITLEGAHGVSATFRCREVTVLAVRPWEAADVAPSA